MWGDNSSTNYGLGNFNWPCIMCHTATVPCLCTNPMIRWYNNVPLSSNNYLNYQRAPESTIYAGFSHASNLVSPPLHVEHDHEASDHMATNEIDSWLMSNPDNDQIVESLNLRSCYASYNEHQYQGGQFIQMQTQGIQVIYNGYYGQSSSIPVFFSVKKLLLPKTDSWIMSEVFFFFLFLPISSLIVFSFILCFSKI
ncbi:hypothetical protein HanPI659440_Chr05g0209131 [Helianthus annuus]|nr:hypothetical protein HanHA300_Chr05g0190481 [Helianthus annuus]KAJ0747818.1 hypothetical protein HanOQP8_Chr05g0193891 [Helianthus annuus]KAJ0789923.1 hypothetical protein HanPI659440_Chr05g0209131 [Helianthus annuus]